MTLMESAIALLIVPVSALLIASWVLRENRKVTAKSSQAQARQVRHGR